MTDSLDFLEAGSLLLPDDARVVTYSQNDVDKKVVETIDEVNKKIADIKERLRTKDVHIVTAALAEAASSMYPLDTTNLDEKTKQFTKTSWQKIAFKKPGGYNLLRSAYTNSKGSDDFVMGDAIAKLSYCRLFWDSFWDGKFALIWWMIIALAMCVALLDSIHQQSAGLCRLHRACRGYNLCGNQTNFGWLPDCEEVDSWRNESRAA